jgi:16S rRNA (guanine966-N2)-methyltransferase
VHGSHFSFSMRIISGAWKGRPLRVPAGTRATTDRVRESLFSILGDPAGLTVLDLYAGSGSLGLEALSRGADAATFVEISKKALALIEANLGKGDDHPVRFHCQDSLNFLGRENLIYDWIFCDPPYQKTDLDRLIMAVSTSACFGDQSLLILETDRFHPIKCPDSLQIKDQRKFGDTLLHFIQRTDPEK